MMVPTFLLLKTRSGTRVLSCVPKRVLLDQQHVRMILDSIYLRRNLTNLTDSNYFIDKKHISQARLYSQQWFTRKYVQNGSSNERSNNRFDLLKLPFSIVLVFVGSLLYEFHWFRSKFKELIPERVEEIGEGSPMKYIYVLDDSPWYFRYFPWQSSCDARVWPYIRETKSDDPTIREQAIRNLASLQSLSDAEYITIASAIDFKTATALAHAGAKPAMVSRPATLHPDKKKMCLATKFREILTALPPDSIHEMMRNTCFAALKAYSPSDSDKLDRHLEAAAGFHTEIESLMPLRKISEESFLRPCLQALLSHSRITYQVPTMIEHGAMDLLLVISERYKNDYEIMGLVLKIFSSFTCCLESEKAFEDTGVLGLLAKYASNDDIRLSFPARKALHNLDRESSKCTLPPGIYQVYPDSRFNEEEFAIDIIFIHGLMGGVFRTWRSQDLNAIWSFKKSDLSKATQCELKKTEKEVDIIRQKILNYDAVVTEEKWSNRDVKPAAEPESIREFLKRHFNYIQKKFLTQRDNTAPRNREIRDGEMYYYPPHEEIPVELDLLPMSPRTRCWPKDWLPLDLNKIRVICADFDTFVTHWSVVMPVESLARTISERSHELVQKLSTAGVGNRPVVWICHSAGGVIVKHVLELCDKSSQEDLRKLSTMTKGVVFCSTPHFGSKIAGLGKSGKSIFLPTVEIIELTQGSKELTRLDQAFQTLVKKHGYRILSFGELCPTLGSVGLSRKLVTVESADPGYGEFFALRVDHLNICKPRSRRSFLYVKIKDFIRDILDNHESSEDHE